MFAREIAAILMKSYAREKNAANVDANGLVTATNALGGEVTVKAVYNGKSGEAIVTVNLKKLLNSAGISGAEQTLLKGASDPDASVQWTYPYDKTVFPRGLLGGFAGGVDKLRNVLLVHESCPSVCEDAEVAGAGARGDVPRG